MEIKYFVVVNEDGQPLGFYNTDVYTLEQIPIGAIEITEAVWKKFLSNQTGYKFSSTGELIVIPPPTPEELEERERNRPPTEMELLGRQLVKREIENLELKADNELLGQQLVNIELKLLTGGV